MKSKAPLTLMEQLVMMLVFALAAALCLQMFVLSGQMSRRLERQDHAVTLVQNAAETVKICGGDAEEYTEILGAEEKDGMFAVGYDAEWNPVSADLAEYLITLTKTSAEDALLGTAEVAAVQADGEEIFRVTVSWQEAAYG